MYIFILFCHPDWNQKNRILVLLLRSCSQQSALGTSPSQNPAPGCPYSQPGCSFHDSLSTSNILNVNFAGSEDKYFPLQRCLDSFKSSCSLRGHWRGALVQGEEDAESIPAVKGLICRTMPNFSVWKERNPLLQTAQSLCQNAPDFLRSWNIGCCFLGDLFRGCVWNSGRSGSVFCPRSKAPPRFPALYHFPLGILFASLGQSQPPRRFSPCPSRVASPELLVFMSVNRFPKLPSQNI